MGLRSLGIFESLELAAYDLCIRLRPDVSEPDPRIVLVTVTEDDIRKQGRWPLTDDVLAQALEILQPVSSARDRRGYLSGHPGPARTRQAQCNLNQQSPSS